MGASIVGNARTTYSKHFGCDACGAKCFKYPLEIFNWGEGHMEVERTCKRLVYTNICGYNQGLDHLTISNRQPFMSLHKRRTSLF